MPWSEADVVVCALSGPLTKTLLIDLAERLGGTTVPARWSSPAGWA